MNSPPYNTTLCIHLPVINDDWFPANVPAFHAAGVARFHETCLSSWSATLARESDALRISNPGAWQTLSEQLEDLDNAARSRCEGILRRVFADAKLQGAVETPADVNAINTACEVVIDVIAECLALAWARYFGIDIAVPELAMLTEED